MSCLLEEPPDVFHHHSSIPPPYLNPENDCNDRDLSDKMEESRGVGLSLDNTPYVEQVTQA